MTDPDPNDAMIREFIAAWERRDSEHIVDAFADDGIYHSTPLSPIVGTAFPNFVQEFGRVERAMSEFTHKVRNWGNRMTTTVMSAVSETRLARLGS